MSTDKDPPASEDKDRTPTTTAVDVDVSIVHGVVASEKGGNLVSTDKQARDMSVEGAEQSEGSGSATQEGEEGKQTTPSKDQGPEAKQDQETPAEVAQETVTEVEVVSSTPSDPTPTTDAEKKDENVPPTVPESRDPPAENLLNGDANNHVENPTDPMESSDVADDALPVDAPAKEEETKEREVVESINGTNDVSEEPTPTRTTMETSEATSETEQPSESRMALDPAPSEEPEKVAADKETAAKLEVSPTNNIPSTEDPATENATEDASEAPKQPPEDPPSSIPDAKNAVPFEKPDDAPMDPPTAKDEIMEPAVAIDTPMQASESAETEIVDGSNKRALEEPSSSDASNPTTAESESVEPPAKQPKLETEAPMDTHSTTVSMMDVEANDKDVAATESAETPQAQDPPTTNAETNVESSEGMDVDEQPTPAVAPLVEETQPAKTEDAADSDGNNAVVPAETVDQVDTVEPKTLPLEIKDGSQNGVSVESATEDTTTPVAEMDVDAATGGPVEPAAAKAEKTAESSEAAPLENGDAVAGVDKPSAMEDTNGDLSEEKNVSNGVEAPAPASDEGKQPAKKNGGASGDKTSKKGRKNNMDPRVLELRRNIQLGCRDNDLASAIQYYDQAVKDGVTVEAQSFYNLLNLCGGIERKIHVGKRKDNDTESADTKFLPLDAVDPKTRQEHAFRVKEHMTQLNIPLNEAAYTAIVKVLVANKDYEKAEEILRESEAVQQCQPKLRLYAPLLTAYCSERQMLSALRCWLAISKQEVQISERESMFLLRCAGATGDPVVFERVFSNLAEDVTVPCKDTVAAVLEWFASAHAMHTGINHPNRARDDEVRKLVDEIHEKESDIAPSIGPVVHKFGWNLDSSVSIDENGVLQEGGLKGVKLNPVQIPESAWNTMIDMNRRIVLEGKLEGHMSEFQGGRKGKIRDDFDPEERKRQWAHFENFLEHVGPLDVVIDAANVGYMNQSFSNAPKHVNYDQIDWVARRFQKMRKRVLLVLHQRHFAKNLMPPKYRYLQDAWERMDILYKTPAGMNDDWFWLHAALKYRTLVLTNDEMRDHHFQMLSPRTFLRWKERHQVHFDFGDWETQGNGYDNDSRTRKVELQFPTPYSRRIQRVQDSFVIPLIKKGDENRFLDGYHVADHDEPEEETYLCICPLKEGESAAPEPMVAMNSAAAPS